MADDIKRMKEEIQIHDLAERIGLDLKQFRDKYVCPCPVCDDPSRGPSRHLYLYPDNKYHCFKCGKSGDIFNLYAFVNNCSRTDSIKEVKKMYGYDVKPTGDRFINASYGSQKTPPPPPPEKDDADIRDPAIQNIYFELTEQYLTLTTRGQEYLSRRGISDETMKKFGLLSMDNPREVAERLKKRFNMSDLVKSGLFFIKDEKPQFSLWQPGIVFVHYRPTHIAGLSVRAYSPTAGQPKYLKPTGVPTVVFEGLLDDESEIFVFEGIINGLSFFELTRKGNFIALVGLLSEQKYKQLLEQYKKKLILALDPDDAGTKCLETIDDCYYLKYDQLCRKYGLDGLPQHEDGKPFDMNEILLRLMEIISQ